MQRIRMRRLSERLEDIPQPIKKQMDCSLLWDISVVSKYLEALAILGCYEIREVPTEDRPVKVNGRVFYDSNDLINYLDGLHDAINLLKEF